MLSQRCEQVENLVCSILGAGGVSEVYRCASSCSRFSGKFVFFRRQCSEEFVAHGLNEDFQFVEVRCSSSWDINVRVVYFVFIASPKRTVGLSVPQFRYLSGLDDHEICRSLNVLKDLGKVTFDSATSTWKLV